MLYIIMDDGSVELAKAWLDAYAEVLSPHLLQVHEALAGRLATNAVQLEDLQQAELSNRANFTFVLDFVNTLPEPRKSYDSFFLVNDAYEARQIQANVFWLTSSPQYNLAAKTQPYYVIGQRAGEPEVLYPKLKTTQLLLYGADSSNTGITRATVWSDQLAIAHNAALRYSSSDYGYDAETLRSMFDADSMQLRVDSARCSLRTQPAGLFTLNASPLFKRKAEKHVTEHGLQVKLDRWKPEQTRLGDGDMADFDVLTHLDLLAVSFGKVEELSQLLENYSTDPASKAAGVLAVHESIENG